MSKPAAPVNATGKAKAKGKGKGKGKAQGQPQSKKGKQDMDVEDIQDIEDAEDDLLEDEDMFDDDIQFFWSMTVPPLKETHLEQPDEDGLICVTHACFGPQVNKGSRSVVACKIPGAKDSIPVCVLTEGNHENQPLDLKFGSLASFSVKGNQPSTVFLTGYIQHQFPGMDDMGDLADMDEEDIDMQEARAKLKYGYPEDEEEEDLFARQPATKKRKIEAPKKAVETKKEKKEPQQNKKDKDAAKTANAPNAPNASNNVATPANNNGKPEIPNAEDKPLSKNQMKKKRKQQKQKESQIQGEPQSQPQTPAQPEQANVDTKSKEQSIEKTDGTENKESKENNEKKENAEKNEIVQLKPTEKTDDASNSKDKDDTKVEQTKVESTEEEPKSPKKNTNESGSKKLPNGIETKDIKVGSGPEIKQGQTLHIFYVGQLDDKTVFDKMLTGEGFEFKLGSDDVIKGWNLGMKGMKVGGKRRISVPSKFAYGIEGSTDKKVPANATVTYTVEIRSPK